MALMRLQMMKRLLRGRRGQSMMAYAVIAAAILGATATLGVKVFPEMLSAVDSFTASMYFSINLPFP